MLGSPFNTDVYVLEWGSGKVADSFTDMIKVCNKYYGLSGFHNSWTKYIANGGVTINFLKFSTEEEAFQVYKQYKERIIKEVIDSYEGKIPEPFYSRLKTAMYNYKVEIDD